MGAGFSHSPSVAPGGLFLSFLDRPEGFQIGRGHTLSVGESGLSRGDMPLKVAVRGHS